MTTCLSDAQEIDNLLGDTTYDSIKYNDASWAYVTDINNLSYQDRIIFSTTVLKQQLVDYNSAFITMPIQLTRAQIVTSSQGGQQTATGPTGSLLTTAADYVSTQAAPGVDPGYNGAYLKGNIYNEPMLAFRDSILNLICGLIVQTDNGQAIVNEYGRLDFINNLRLKIENSIDWMQTMGSLLHFSLDSCVNSFYTGLAQPYNVASGQNNVANDAALAPTGFGGASLARNFFNNSVNPFLPDANMRTGVYSNWPNTTDYSGAAGSGGQGLATSNALPINPTPTQYGSGLAIASIVPGTFIQGTSTVTGTSTTFVAAMVGGTFYFTGGAAAGYTITAVTSATVLTIDGIATSAGVTAGNWVITYYIDPTIGPAATITTPVAIPNPGFNQGLMNRIQFFQNASVYSAGSASVAGSFSIVAKIPLRLLHDFFEQLDFPVINLGFNIQLILRQPNNQGGSTNPSAPTPYQNIPPIQAGSLYGPNGTTPFATWTTGAPAIQYGAGLQTGLYGQGCRLYYRSIKLNPTENDAFKTKLMRGFTKKIKFISTDSYSPTQAVYTKTGNSLLIAPSVVWPLRVWVLLYSNGTAANTGLNAQTGALCGNWGSGPPGTAAIAQAAQCGLQCTHGWMTNANILVNNQPYYKTPLMTPDDFWLIFKDQLNRNTGCMISYQDFITKFRYHCFDLSRLSDRLPSKTEAVSLVLNFDRQDVTGGSCDPIIMIERLNQVQMDFSASDVTITVGNITA